MIYIDKNTEPTSIEAAKALHFWRDNHKFSYQNGKEFNKKQKEEKAVFSAWFEKYKRKLGIDIEGKIFEEIYQSLNPETAWNLIEEYGEGLKQQLREALAHEQNHICCYCLQDINIIKTVIEHFLARSEGSDGILKNTYNYDNLLLSCDGNNGESADEAKYQVKKEDKSWEDIVESIKKINKKREDFTIDVASLKEMNPLRQTDLVPKGQLIYRMSPRHCDNFKGNKTDKIINPTISPDCWARFQYHDKGLIEGKDEQATLTITVLNLNAHILQENRRTIWKGFAEELNKSPESVLQDAGNWADWRKFLQAQLDKEKELIYAFCTVRRALLLKKIEEAQLLERSTPSV